MSKKKPQKKINTNKGKQSKKKQWKKGKLECYIKNLTKNLNILKVKLRTWLRPSNLLPRPPHTKYV
jgi:hypothetical protein